MAGMDAFENLQLCEWEPENYAEHVAKVRMREAGTLASDLWPDANGQADRKAERRSYELVAQLWWFKHPDTKGWGCWDAAAAYVRENPPECTANPNATPPG